MTTFFTADLHLRHKRIMQLCHRDIFLKDIRKMNNGLIANWNRVVTKHDVIYHIGDFCYTDNPDIYAKYMHRIHGKTIFIRGNHDVGLQHANYYICRNIEGMKIFMRHWPPWQILDTHKKYGHQIEVPIDVDLILCGHVHNAWKWKYYVHKIGQRKIPVINIGTDVWGYKPVSLNNIMEEIGKWVSAKQKQ